MPPRRGKPVYADCRSPSQQRSAGAGGGVASLPGFEIPPSWQQDFIAQEQHNERALRRAQHEASDAGFQRAQLEHKQRIAEAARQGRAAAQAHNGMRATAGFAFLGGAPGDAASFLSSGLSQQADNSLADSMSGMALPLHNPAGATAEARLEQYAAYRLRRKAAARATGGTSLGTLGTCSERLKRFQERRTNALADSFANLGVDRSKADSHSGISRKAKARQQRKLAAALKRLGFEDTSDWLRGSGDSLQSVPENRAFTTSRIGIGGSFELSAQVLVLLPLFSVLLHLLLRLVLLHLLTAPRRQDAREDELFERGRLQGRYPPSSLPGGPVVEMDGGGGQEEGARFSIGGGIQLVSAPTHTAIGFLRGSGELTLPPAGGTSGASMFQSDASTSNLWSGGSSVAALTQQEAAVRGVDPFAADPHYSLRRQFAGQTL